MDMKQAIVVFSVLMIGFSLPVCVSAQSTDCDVSIDDSITCGETILLSGRANGWTIWYFTFDAFPNLVQSFKGTILTFLDTSSIQVLVYGLDCEELAFDPPTFGPSAFVCPFVAAVTAQHLVEVRVLGFKGAQYSLEMDCTLDGSQCQTPVEGSTWGQIKAFYR